MLVPAFKLIKASQKNHYALGHFNINGLNWITVYLQTAQETNSPVILATSDRLVDQLGGFQYLADVTRYFIRELQITIPVVLHLDHGTSVEHTKQAIAAGYTSVMFDGSQLPIADNVRLTKEVVDYAHARNVSVEAEVGAVGGNENGIISGIKYASVEDAVQMKNTGIDFLAAALGSVHGDYVGKPNLNFERMQQISQVTGLPLVLHGASGIPDDQIQNAIKMGTNKININTEINYAWINAVRKRINRKDAGHEPLPMLKAGNEAIKQMMLQKMQQFHVLGKANITKDKVEENSD